jgi:hypothetical protein
MLRSDLDQRHPENLFSLKNISANHFDNDLKRWAEGARAFGRPLLIEWGTEPNGEWFAWNGKWHGHAAGPPQYVQAYRHIVEVMRDAGADNLQWVWHVNWDDVPVAHWNRLENYFPGSDYCAWLAQAPMGHSRRAPPTGLRVFGKRWITFIRALPNWHGQAHHRGGIWVRHSPSQGDRGDLGARGPAGSLLWALAGSDRLLLVERRLGK